MYEYYNCPILQTCKPLKRKNEENIGEKGTIVPIPTCIPGKYLENGLCKTCEAGYYCKNNIRTPCNPENPTIRTRYYSPPGFSKCYTNCPSGLYKNQISGKLLTDPKLYTCETCPFGKLPVLDSNKSYNTGKNSNFCIDCNNGGKTITDVNTSDNLNKYTYNTCI